MASLAQRNPVRHVEPQIGVSGKRQDVMRVQLFYTWLSAAVLACLAIPAFHLTGPDELSLAALSAIDRGATLPRGITCAAPLDAHRCSPLCASGSTAPFVAVNESVGSALGVAARRAATARALERRRQRGRESMAFREARVLAGAVSEAGIGHCRDGRHFAAATRAEHSTILPLRRAA